MDFLVRESLKRSTRGNNSVYPSGRRREQKLVVNNVRSVTFVLGFDCKCGVPTNSLSPRIVGGLKVPKHSYPWTVAIIREEMLHCGASIITDRHVLCAGHCFKWSDHKQMQVVLGLDSLDDMKAVVTRNIKYVIIHENFTSTQVRDDNDLAVVTLEVPMQFGPTMLPVCLPPSSHSYTNWTATVAGWGRMGTNDPTSSALQRADVRILSWEQCITSELGPHLTENMMCAFAERKDGCQGDSGGPLTVFDPSGHFIQIGVVSWGIGCADPRFPGVYTNISRYIDWILSHTSEGITCS